MSPTPTKSSQINTRSATVNKKASSPVTMDDLHRSIAEIRSSQIDMLGKCKICACNIIVHGLQESSSNDPTVRIASDIKLLDDNIHPCNLTLPQDLKLFRLGHKIVVNLDL